jgi:hypothetical protein
MSHGLRTGAILATSPAQLGYGEEDEKFDRNLARLAAIH